MSDILQKILARKAEEVAERRTRVPQAELAARCRDTGPTRGFAAALERRVAAGSCAEMSAARRCGTLKENTAAT